MAKRARGKSTVKISSGAMHARAKFEEAKHKRDAGGRFDDKPGASNTAQGGPGGPGSAGASKGAWTAAAKSSGVTGSDKIRLHVTANPKKAGSASADRFAKYKDGMTVDEYIAAGGTREDLAWDRKKGFMTIHDEPTYAKLSGQAGKSTAEINELGATGRLADIKKSVEAPPQNLKEATASPGTPPRPAAPAEKPKAEPKPAGAPAAELPKTQEQLYKQNMEWSKSAKKGKLSDDDVVKIHNETETLDGAKSGMTLGEYKAAGGDDSKLRYSFKVTIHDPETFNRLSAIKPKHIERVGAKDIIMEGDKTVLYGEDIKHTKPEVLTDIEAGLSSGKYTVKPIVKSTSTLTPNPDKLANHNVRVEPGAADWSKVPGVKAVSGAKVGNVAAELMSAGPLGGPKITSTATEKQFNEMMDAHKAMGLPYISRNTNSGVEAVVRDPNNLLNKNLRDSGIDSMNAKDRNTIGQLDAIMQETKADVVMWRGMQVKGGLNDMPPPNEFTDMGYVSMSHNPAHSAKVFAGTTSDEIQALFKVRVPQGTKAASVGYENTVERAMQDEAEVMVARGTRFKYIGTTEANVGGKKSKIIEVEIVRNDGMPLRAPHTPVKQPDGVKPLKAPEGEKITDEHITVAKPSNKVAMPKKMPNDHKYKATELYPLPHDRMADETNKGLEWEYEVEYKKYGGQSWGPGINSQEDFNKRYKAAPLTYLNDDQYNNLGYTSINMNSLPTYNDVHKQIGHRRDPKAIQDRMFNGVTTPPIVLRKNGKLRLMAGQSRIFTGFASGFRVPVKVLDV